MKQKYVPIQLKAIWEHAMDCQETKYEMSIIIYGLKAMMTTKKREGENLVEYMWWFKPAKDVLESHIGGALILTKYIKGMADKIEKRTASFETCAKRPMQDCFHSCIWRILIKWSKVQSCETWYNKSHLARINIQKQEQRQTTFWVTIDLMWQTKESKRNHQESTKKRWRITKTSFAQTEGKCYCCRKGCHKSPQCHHKNRPKE